MEWGSVGPSAPADGLTDVSRHSSRLPSVAAATKRSANSVTYFLSTRGQNFGPYDNYVKQKTGRPRDDLVVALINVCSRLADEYDKASPVPISPRARRPDLKRTALLRLRTRLREKQEELKTGKKKRKRKKGKKPGTRARAKATRSGTQLKGS